MPSVVSCLPEKPWIVQGHCFWKQKLRDQQSVVNSVRHFVIIHCYFAFALLWLTTVMLETIKNTNSVGNEVVILKAMF